MDDVRTEQQRGAVNCAVHRGAWAANCKACEAMRQKVIARKGEWSLGDSGEIDAARGPMSVSLSAAELYGLQRCVGWAATGSDNPSDSEIEHATAFLQRVSPLSGEDSNG